jgi:hypothetical protein
MHSLILKGVAIACISVALSACGSGSDDPAPVAANSGGATTPAPGASTGGTPAASGGTFLAAIIALLGSTSDTSSPVSVDSYDATSSDTASPEPVS